MSGKSGAIIMRLLETSDAREVLRLYKPHVESTTVSLEHKVPTEDEIKRRIRNSSAKYPWIAVFQGQRLLGFAYAAQHRTPESYQWIVEVSIYVDQDFRRRYIGKALYTALFKILKFQGFQKAIVVIVAPNKEAEGFHKNFGFQTIAIYENIGFKCGQWCDTKHMIVQIRLDPYPPKIASIEDIVGTPEWMQIIKAAKSFIKAA